MIGTPVRTELILSASFTETLPPYQKLERSINLIWKYCRLKIPAVWLAKGIRKIIKSFHFIWFCFTVIYFQNHNQHLLPREVARTYAITTAQKMKFSIKDFFSTCDQIRRNFCTIVQCIYLRHFRGSWLYAC